MAWRHCTSSPFCLRGLTLYICRQPVHKQWCVGTHNSWVEAHVCMLECGAADARSSQWLLSLTRAQPDSQRSTNDAHSSSLRIIAQILGSRCSVSPPPQRSTLDAPRDSSHKHAHIRVGVLLLLLSIRSTPYTFRFKLRLQDVSLRLVSYSVDLRSVGPFAVCNICISYCDHFLRSCCWHIDCRSQGRGQQISWYSLRSVPTKALLAS